MSSFNLTNLNETKIDMWLAPANNWHQDISNFEMKKINFTWVATKFETNNTLTVQLNFSDPSYISPTRIYDMLVVEILHNDTFVSILGEILNKTSMIL